MTPLNCESGQCMSTTQQSCCPANDAPQAVVGGIRNSTVDLGDISQFKTSIVSFSIQLQVLPLVSDAPAPARFAAGWREFVPNRISAKETGEKEAIGLLANVH